MDRYGGRGGSTARGPAWSYATDDFGVPANMFGEVPEVFYGVVGRIVMIASIVELRLLHLTDALGTSTPSRGHAGRSAATLIKLCRKQLDGSRFAALAADGDALLSRVRDGLDDRNAVVHSAWPHPTLEDAFGWRPVVAGLREPGGVDINRCLVENREWFRGLIERLVHVVDDLDRFRDRVQAATS